MGYSRVPFFLPKFLIQPTLRKGNVMIEGEEWKYAETMATPADVIKYCAQKTKLLVEMKDSSRPFEARIAQTLNDGELCAITVAVDGGHSPFMVFVPEKHWVHTSDLSILAVFPPEPAPGLTDKELLKAFSEVLPKRKKK